MFIQTEATPNPATLKFIPGWRIGPAPLDQLPGDRWFTIMGPINNTNFTFYLQCNSADHTAFPAQCPVGPTHQFDLWNYPDKCPRCNLILDKNVLPYRIWD